MNAPERIAELTRTFEEQDADLAGGDPLRFEGYDEQLGRARSESGMREACLWGWAEIEGAACALVVGDFSFLGGSMGVVVGEKVARAFDAARASELPVVVVCASGGARMQEGMVALVQMVKTAEAQRRHAAAGGGQVAFLTSPTTGGVYASFASRSDVILAEPRATIGFAGPRVVEELTGSEPPTDVHTAEFAFEQGLIDALVPPDEAAPTIARVLRGLTSSSGSGKRVAPRTAPLSPSGLSAWERLQLARDPLRPKAPAMLDLLLTDAFELHGDRLGTNESSVVVRLGALAPTGRRVMAIGQDASGDGRIRPGGYRKAIRAVRMAAKLGLPVVTLIDTRGADPLPDSEAAGVASAVAWTFVSVLDCPSPTVAVVTGEGGSGGALAMAPADRVLAFENAVFSVIAPEAAASVLFRDSSQAPELAERLRITAPDLVELAIVDTVVPEPPGGAQANPQAAVGDLAEVIALEIEELAAAEPASRLERRHERWREAGNRFLQQAPG